MAYLFSDGFDHYGNLVTMEEGPWDKVAAGPTQLQARTGSYSLYVAQYSTARMIIPGTGSTFGVAHAMYLTQLPSNGSQEMPIQVYEALGANLEYGRLTVDYQGTLRFYDSAGTVVAESPVGTMKVRQWLHFEAKIFTDATDGTMALKINELPIMAATGVPCGPAITGLKAVRFASPSPVVTFDWFLDDLVIWDDADTSTNADWVGDQRLYISTANSDNTLGWTPSTGGTGYNLINSIPPDDTKFISSNNSGDYADFGHTQLPPEATVISGVVVVGRTQKNTAGACKLKIGINSGGTVELGPEFGPSTAWNNGYALFDRDPHTAGAWSKATFEAAKIAIDRTA